MMTTNRQNGFTLFELLVVLLVMALTAALVGPMYRGGQKSDLNVFGRSLVAELRYARSMALLKGRNSVVSFDMDKRLYGISEGGEQKSIPREIHMKLTVDENDAGDGKGLIYFFADGSSTGGIIELSREGKKLMLTTSWLNGRISIEESRS